MLSIAAKSGNVVSGEFSTEKAVKTGEKACPFNSLYWNFYDKNEDKLGKNPRIGMMYNVWHKMKPDDKAALLQQADYYLKNINEL